ncbi:MAG: apolipoprotein N-acyltransferase [Rickettsia sp.]|nr:apolipoprotein N-acyltransferase [Rickettsia sp.]
MLKSKKFLFIYGVTLSTIFAPLYFLVFIISLSVLLRSFITAFSMKDAFSKGYVFGFGFYLANFYWFAIAISQSQTNIFFISFLLVLILPMLMSNFIGLLGALIFRIKNAKYVHLLFVIFWVLLEYLIEHLLFQFPWAFIGYSAGFSIVFAQSASVFGVYGLSLTLVYIGSMFYECKITKNFIKKLITICLISVCMYSFGIYRINSNKTEFLEYQVRLVQPSIEQSEKWSYNFFHKNMNLLIDLSKKDITDKINLVIWPESAITIPYESKILNLKLKKLLENQNFILISGNITEKRNKIYVSMIGINDALEKIFTYKKFHLVPFGEYIPSLIAKIFPLEKITQGAISFSPGKSENFFLQNLNLSFTPLICYEIIFPSEVRSRINKSNCIINIANDAWYGNSSQPYQHYNMSVFRAIENAIPVIRVSNNGISAVIDSLGKTIKKTKLNDITYLDSHIPQSLKKQTIFSLYGNIIVIFYTIIILILENLIAKFLIYLTKNNSI